jgi:histidinol-phosphate/aromatic aminotransferase/cobyric acid decarboxylase-like protein
MSIDIGEEDLSALLKRHADLESIYGDGDGGSFLSGWQCENPWIDQIKALVQAKSTELQGEKYLYLDEDKSIRDGLSRFHGHVDGVIPQGLFCGVGSSSIIFTFCAWLKHNAIAEVFYIPPLYFSFHFALKLFDIRARAVSGKHAFEEGFSMRLPSERAVLLLTDPVWYAGLPLGAEVIETLVAWQRMTSSLVFVDGSFQYAKWEGPNTELAAQFDPEFSFRLICPTKSLAAHGYRFAYTIIPARLHQGFATLYSNIYGSATIEDVAFGRTAVAAISEGTVTRLLMRLAADRHRSFRKAGTIFAAWQPSSGYFVFERISSSRLDSRLLMDGSYFEQKRYHDYRRINLLSPSIILLN